MGEERFDVIVVGGGPAGLSAALVLGRALRSVLLIDEHKPRNRFSRAVHGFLTRDGTPPGELREIARQQLRRYDSVRIADDRVLDARCTEDGFVVATAQGLRHRARKLILATGLVDDLPDVDGLRDLFGRSVFNCPYCDGYELRDSPLAIYGVDDARGGQYALELLGWSRDLVLCTDGASALTPSMQEQLARNGIRIRNEPIARLEAQDGVLSRIVFTEGPPLARRAMFVNTPHREASDLAQRLGVEGASGERCEVGKRGRTNVPGLFVAGDAARDVLQVAIAAGEGCEAAMTAHTELLRAALR
jgi:thioredoxin reductase